VGFKLIFLGSFTKENPTFFEQKGQVGACPLRLQSVKNRSDFPNGQLCMVHACFLIPLRYNKINDQYRDMEFFQ